jgi:exopolysaccharide biosynthesis polyprenyl glycosylphosphotransferase
MWPATSPTSCHNGVNGLPKRALDILVSSFALVLLTIPFGIVAVLIKVTSRGPVFYRQVRMSLDGEPFTMVKFRSMYRDAERSTGPVWTQRNDPRVTPLGRFLRRSNLDELPQLWNVLRGDMSIVGPRPERPHFVEQFSNRLPRYMLRHSVRAGLTGWAQVNGWRGNTPIETRIEHDLYYIENWSVHLDLRIIWLTVIRGFFHDHAY